MIKIALLMYTKRGALAGVGWAVWQPGTCQVGRLVRRPGGPPRQMLKEGVEQRRGPTFSSLGMEGSTRINYLHGSEFLVTPLLMGPVCLINQGRFEEPVSIGVDLVIKVSALGRSGSQKNPETDDTFHAVDRFVMLSPSSSTSGGHSPQRPLYGRRP